MMIMQVRSFKRTKSLKGRSDKRIEVEFGSSISKVFMSMYLYTVNLFD